MAISNKEKRKWIAKGKSLVDEGLPGWFSTFADMMTLLFAFFVLLAAISTIDPVKLQEMSDALNKSVGKTIKKKGAMTLADVQKAVNAMVKQNNLEDAVEVKTGPKGVTVQISSDISFEPASAETRPEFRPILEKIVPTIQKSYFMVAIEGHTDSDPIPERVKDIYPSNWELSAARAAAVVRMLIELGVDPLRLQAVGYAENVPRDRRTDRVIDQDMIRKLNMTEELKARNRRVEITFLPSG